MPRISGAGARGGLKGAGEGVNTGEGHEGWSFIEPTDLDFIEAYPEVARREEERWQAISPWLETDPAIQIQAAKALEMNRIASPAQCNLRGQCC